MADIVDDFLQRLAAHIPDAPLEVRYQLETSMRQAWGGNKPYVAKQTSRTTRATLVATSLRQGRPIAECFAQAGVSRATGYRILSSK